LKNFKQIIIIFFLVLGALSCKKDKRILGTDTQPDGDALNASFTDTFTIFAHTKKYDVAIASFNDGFKYIGSNQDPVFGRTDIGLYCNATMNLSNVNFGLDANLVSAELIYVVPINSDFVGDTATHLTYSVYPITTTLSTSAVYYTTNDSLFNKNTPIGGGNVGYSLFNGLLVVRIPINYNFANAIFSNPQYLVDNATFTNQYKGFYVTSKTTPLFSGKEGIIAKFNLNDAASGFYLNYTNGLPSAVKEYKSFKFNFSGPNAVRFNTSKYQPILTTQILQDQYYNIDTTQGIKYLYLKGMGATRVRMFIPSLNFLKKYNDTVPLAINRAEIILNIEPSYPVSTIYAAPPKLALLPLDSLGKETLTQDQLSSADFVRYDGNYDSDRNRYVFNIARHVQALIKGGRKNYGFNLVVADGNRNLVARRDIFINGIVISGGFFNAALKPKFNLSFVKFKNE